MELSFSSEQEMLRDAVRGVCERHSPLDLVRTLEDDPIGYPQPLLASLAEIGVCGLGFAAHDGGSGMSTLDGVVVFTELGRSLAPNPVFSSSVLCGGLLSSAGSPEQRGHWLPKLAAGDAILAHAWFEPGRGFGPAGVAVTARAGGAGRFVVSGVKRHVPFASAADALVVAVRLGSPAPDGPIAFVLVDRAAPGVSLEQELTLASDSQYRIQLEDVEVDGGAIVGAPGTAADWDDREAVLERGLILLGAQAVGYARAALDLAAQYAKDRRQFGKPLGAFQALAHYLADAATAVDGAETLVWEAAWAHDQGRAIGRLAPMAKLFACRTARQVTATAHQIFGGIGFTVEADVQLYFRRAKQLQISWLDDASLEDRIAADILEPFGAGTSAPR